MLGLIYKDIMINKKTFLLALLGLTFLNTWTLIPALLSDDFASSLASFPMLFQGLFLLMAVCSFYIGGMIEDGLTAHDENKKYAYFIASTEDGVKNLVGGKYMLCVIFSIAQTFFCIFCNDLAIDIIGDETPNLQSIIITMFYVQMFCRAVSYPFIFAYGSKMGNNVKAVFFMAIVAAGLIYLMFGDLSFITEHSDELWDKFFGLITDMNSSWKLMLWQALGCLASLALLYFSYRISCKVYMKGVERFEK